MVACFRIGVMAQLSHGVKRMGKGKLNRRGPFRLNRAFSERSFRCVLWQSHRNPQLGISSGIIVEQDAPFTQADHGRRGIKPTALLIRMSAN